MGAYPDLSPAPPQAGYPPAALAPGGNDVLSWIRDEDRDAMKLGSFSPAAHGDLAALTGAAGGRGAEADGAGAGVGPGGWGGGGGSGAGGGSGVGASASSIPPESPHRAAAPIRVVVAQPFRIPPPVRLPPPPAPCPALQAAERKAAGMAAGSDDAFEKAAIDLADQELPTFLDVRTKEMGRGEGGERGEDARGGGGHVEERGGMARLRPLLRPPLP